MQKGQVLIFLLVGILFIAAAGGAYYLGRSTSPKPSSTPPVTSQTPQPTPTPSSSDETVYTEATRSANWKTYTNTKHSYLIKLPITWQPDRGYPGGQYTDEELQEQDWISWVNNKSRFSIQVLSSCSTTLESCFKKHQEDADKAGGPYKTALTTTKNGTFSGISTLIARTSYSGSQNTVKGIFLIYSGKLWLIETQSLPSISVNVEKETDQILSTFKFLP